MSSLNINNSNLSQNTAVQTNSDRKYFIKINKGSDKGSVFQLSSNEVLIGRDPSNHIQLKNDAKISRHHVRLLFKDQKYFVQDITKNNYIIVNGIKVKQGELKNNEIIQVGDHVLQYVETEPQKNNPNFNIVKKPESNRLRLVLIIGLFLGSGFYFSSPSNKVVTSKLETFESEAKSERRIDSLDDSIEALDKKFKESIFYSENGKNAQSLFIQGKRDFDRGQFFYARDAFGAVLSLEPSHPEARRMLRLSQQYSEDLLEKQFKEGLASRDVGRFEICKSAMKNIMNLTNNPSNSRYLEAKKVAEECELMKKGNL